MSRREMLTAQLKAIADEGREAREIFRKAKSEKRNPTADEQSKIDAYIEKANPIQEALDDLARDDQIRAAAKELADTIGGSTSSSSSGHLAFTGKHAKALTQTLISKLPRDEMGTKAVTTGAVALSNIVLPEIVVTGRPAVSLLDVLPARKVPVNYSFLRQTTRTNNAAPVAVGGMKPTSVVSVDAVPNRLRPVAHLSEQIDQYLLSDVTNLERFIDDELVYMLRRKLEAQILAGDGTGENMTGILNTSGIVVQAFTTSALVSVRKAITTLETTDYTPQLIVLSAGDWEAIELAVSSTNAIEHMSLPIDPIARRLWGIPVVLNQGLGAKTGLVIADNAVTVDHDGGIETRWSENIADDFAKNYKRARVEGRFGVSVNQPAAVVKVGTAA